MRSLAALQSELDDSPREGLEAARRELPDLLAAHPDALRGEAGAAFLAKVCDEARSDGIGADVVELVTARGACVPLLPHVVAMSCRDDAQRLRITRRVLELGAKPSDSADGKSALAACAPGGERELVQLLVEHADQPTLREALLETLASDHARAPANEALVLERLTDVNFVGPAGLAPVHVAALHADAARLSRLLDRNADLSAPLGAGLLLTGHDCVPPEGNSFVPCLSFAVGSTSRDLVEQALGLYRTYQAAYGSKGATARLKHLERLEGVAALLAARGARHGEPVRDGLPAWTGEMEGLLAVLASSFGVAPARALRAASAIDVRGIGPWTYFARSLEVLGPSLLQAAPAKKDTWLTAVMAGSAITARKPNVKGLSKESKLVVKNGSALAAREGATLMVWTPKPGLAQFVVVEGDRHTVVAEDAATFIRHELGELGVDTSSVELTTPGLMRGPSDGPSFHPRRLRAGPDAPGPAVINRVGGLPIGVDEATWPRFEGKPMHHVLTLDLSLHPSLRVPGKRAVALFLSSPRRHEASAPHTDHAHVLLLDDAALAKGEPAWPPDLEPERIPGRALIVDDALAATRRERLRCSHAAWLPTFLQGEDGVWEAKPGDFVLQFDADLVPSVNSGDLGVFYLFTKTAWFQCH